MLQRLLGSLLFIFALGGCTEPPYTNVDNEQLKTLLTQGVPVYDIRRPEEWQQTGVVEGSRKLTFIDVSGRVSPEFLSRFATEVSRETPVILICRTGNRTDTLARHLVENLGYTQVYNVRDGITRWISAGNAIIKQ